MSGSVSVKIVFRGDKFHYKARNRRRNLPISQHRLGFHRNLYTGMNNIFEH